MPTYLCHGFRWHRRRIRPFVILNDLDDAAPDWIIGPVTSSIILEQFSINFPFLPRLPVPSDEATAAKTCPGTGTGPVTKSLHYDEDFSVPPSRTPAEQDSVLVHQDSPVKLLEEYDLGETVYPTRPYAYVADYVTRVDLSANIIEEMAKYANAPQYGVTGWFEKLRGELQPEEKTGWYVVVCDDEERLAPESEDDYESSGEGPPTPVQERVDGESTQKDSQESLPETNSGRSALSGSDAGQRQNAARELPIRSLRHKSSQALRRLFRKKDA